MLSACSLASAIMISACARALATSPPLSVEVCRSEILGVVRLMWEVPEAGPALCSGNSIGVKAGGFPASRIILADILIACTSAKTQQSFIFELARHFHNFLLGCLNVANTNGA